MLFCMRTTLDLDDDLMRAAKARAASTGRTLTSLMETALRDLLEREQRVDEAPFQLRWVVVDGGAQPGVDVADRDALHERMDGRG